jgi:tetratricopeptide (TPR) repeat protein
MFRALFLALALNAGAPASTTMAPLAAPAVATASPEAEQALKLGWARLNAGDAEGAEHSWQEGLQHGEDSGLLYSLGGLLFQAQRLAEAEDCFQRLARRSPALADGWYQLGLVRAARGRYAEAADAQRLAVAQSPQFGQAYCALALDLRELGRNTEALPAAQKALECLPAYAGAWNLRANLLQDQGQYQAALQDYDAALRLEPRYAGAWFNRAQLLHEKLGKPGQARQSYGYAIQCRPGFAEAYLARAELALVQRRFADADADFRAVTRLPGWEPEAWWGLSRAAKGLGSGGEAECLVRYRSAVHRRDKALDRERAQGVERPMPYEPGLPLAASGTPFQTALKQP